MIPRSAVLFLPALLAAAPLAAQQPPGPGRGL
jgi:hypothetical protein